MKQLYSLFCMLALSQFTWAQEFSFQMYFEDSAGNKDTLTIGYDVNGTDSIDAVFGESNIISTPLSQGLDVRISNEWYNRYRSLEGTFHTKKQITQITEKHGNRICIDIFTQHWPVTATWDSIQFNNSARNGSLFTSINPGGWWDTGSPSDLYRADFKFTERVTFTSNHDAGYFNENYAYINNNNDTIPVFWLAFGDSAAFSTGIKRPERQDDIKIYPNPTSNYLTIQSANPNLRIKEFRLFEPLGKEYLLELTDDQVNLNSISEGMYFLRITLQSGQIVMKKIIKK
jgi:hypothetical protein